MLNSNKMIVPWHRHVAKVRLESCYQSLDWIIHHSLKFIITFWFSDSLHVMYYDRYLPTAEFTNVFLCVGKFNIMLAHSTPSLLNCSSSRSSTSGLLLLKLNVHHVLFPDLHGQGYHSSRVGQQSGCSPVPTVRLQGRRVRSELLWQIPPSLIHRVQKCSFYAFIKIIKWNIVFFVNTWIYCTE